MRAWGVGRLGYEVDVLFFLYAARKFLDHLIITMTDEALNEFVGQCAVEVELVPMLLVHVPGSRDFGMGIAKREGVIGLALKDEPLRTFQIEHRKNLSSDAKGEGGFVEGEILGHEWERKALFSD